MGQWHALSISGSYVCTIHSIFLDSTSMFLDSTSMFLDSTSMFLDSTSMFSLPSRYKVVFVNKDDKISSKVNDVTMMSSSLPACPPTPSREHPFLARLVSNERVTPTSHFQDVRLVTFDIEGSGIR